jgi:hypothetical protein
MASFLDNVFATFDEKTARRELEAARRQVQSIQELLAAYERWAEGRGKAALNGSDAGAPTQPGSGGRGRASRVLIMQLLQQGGEEMEWTTKDVRNGLGLGEDSDHGIQIALSRLFRSNELERPRKGVYRLPRDRSHGPGEETEGMGTLAMPPESLSG